MISDFTRPLGWTLRGSEKKGSFFRGGRSGQTTGLASRGLFFIRRCRGCWGRRWALCFPGMPCREFSSSSPRRWWELFGFSLGRRLFEWGSRPFVPGVLQLRPLHSFHFFLRLGLLTSLHP